MISNFVSPFLCLQDTLEFEFHLTGSRFFGGYRRDSDWDFFVQDSEDVVKYLAQQGFKPVLSRYKDATVVMFRSVNGIDIDVQLVSDVNVKLKAQEMLKPFLAAIPKQYHKELWRRALVEAAK